MSGSVGSSGISPSAVATGRPASTWIRRWCRTSRSTPSSVRRLIAERGSVDAAVEPEPWKSCAITAGGTMATMRDVAEQAGVSAKTVSRVLRNDRYVSDAVRERVNAAINDLQYVPNMLAVSFRTGRDAAIGVAVPDIADPFFAQIVHSVEVEARARRTAVIVTSLGYQPEFEQGAVEALLQRQVSGTDRLSHLPRPVLPGPRGCSAHRWSSSTAHRPGSRLTASSRTTPAEHTWQPLTCWTRDTGASPSSATLIALRPRCSDSRATPRPWRTAESPSTTGSSTSGDITASAIDQALATLRRTAQAAVGRLLVECSLHLGGLPRSAATWR